MRYSVSQKGLVFPSALLILFSPAADAGQTDLAGPPEAGQFGRVVASLPNGNFVVTAPDYTPPQGPSAAGAVFLYRGDGTLVSTLTGSQKDDRVGYGGVTVLANGNFLVVSHLWDNGKMVDAGAVTWGSMTTGVSGVVSPENSLVGSFHYDQIGGVNTETGVAGGVKALSNGNYVVRSPAFRVGTAAAAGAVTWGNGLGGTVGVINASNSLVGTVVNSAVGTHLSGGGVYEVKGSNYVVCSPGWKEGTAGAGGAVTWCDGSAGRAGPVTLENSLVGASPAHGVGRSVYGAGVVVLANGNYVVSSEGWDGGALTDLGAVTWCSGDTGRTGFVSETNSLVGSAAGDHISGIHPSFRGLGGIIPLTNGHYVVASPFWDKGNMSDAGAVTWCDGTRETVGGVTAANSLTGTIPMDLVGRVTALPGGNYAAGGEYWNNGGVPDAGAVRWMDGSGPGSGTLSPANSLVGTTAQDRVSLGGITALTNGNFVVSSPRWTNGDKANAGAVTWVNAAQPLTGAVTAANSLVGGRALDYVGGTHLPDVGLPPGVTALTNGNYVVASPACANGALGRAGAVTWGNGTTGTAGEVSAANSLAGGAANCFVGGAFEASRPGGITPLANGHYLVRSPAWKNEAIQMAGAVTWRNGEGPDPGVVTAENSLVGSHKDQYLGAETATAFPGGFWALRSSTTDTGGAADSGAVMFGTGQGPVAGTLSFSNSVIGTTANGGTRMSYSFDAGEQRLIVGRAYDRLVTFFTFGEENVSKVEVRNGGGTAVLAAGATVDFGEVNPGAVKALSVAFTNKGYAPLRLEAALSSDPRFTLLLPEGVSSLERNATLRVGLLYKPEAAGDHTSTLRVTTNDPAVPFFEFKASGKAVADLPHRATDLVGPPGSQYFGASTTYLPNGNLVVTDPCYDAPGPVANVGAVYLYSPTGALISQLTGSTESDQVGNGGITVLADGDFVICSAAWSNAGAARAGAVTWASGATGISGQVSAANSLVGTKADDNVGGNIPSYGQPSVFPLPGGNYVVISPGWDTFRGAVTWGSGEGGVKGPISSVNSLTGTAAGPEGITILTNGNYVIKSDVHGRVTWLPGTGPTQGLSNSVNSLSTGNGVSVTALTDGNYVVVCPTYSGGPWQNGGAVAWRDGAVPATGGISAATALMGSSHQDRLGSGGVVALPGGRYAVLSPYWKGDTGAVTWGPAGAPLAGEVTAGNSLTGSTAGDRVGLGGITALREGRAVVASPDWANGAVPGAGAVTWSSPSTPVTGAVSAANSLVGVKAGDMVGFSGVAALESGDYVVASAFWDGAYVNQGAVTWCDGAAGRTGVITAANSLTGPRADCLVGYGGVRALKSGAYVALSGWWKNAAGAETGAVTWMSGPTDSAGVVSGANSLIGCRGGEVLPLANGHYVVHSLSWSENRGALTWGNGWKPLTGAVSSANSLVGSRPDDYVGASPSLFLNYNVSALHAFPDGHFLARSPLWDNGDLRDTGALTLGNGQGGQRGPVSSGNSVTGPAAFDNLGRLYDGAVFSGNAFAILSRAARNPQGTGAGVAVLGASQAGAWFSGTPDTRFAVFAEAKPIVAFPINASPAPSSGGWAVGRPQDSVVTLYSRPGPAVGVPALELEGGIDLPDGSGIPFGVVAPGQSRERAFRIVNRGGAALNLSALTMTDPRFTLTEPWTPMALAAGESVTVTVRFSPVAPGLKTAVVSVTSEGAAGPLTLNLEGAGAALESQPFGPDAEEPGEIAAASGGAAVTVRFPGVPGVTYLLEKSADLTEWVPFTLVVADAEGGVTVEDDTPGAAKSFYRLRAR